MLSSKNFRQILKKFPSLQIFLFKLLIKRVEAVAETPASVLLLGESGVGKELVARALHEHSPRAGKPFVALNTSAIAAELLESELFGHERGAFTGADAQREGAASSADGGTLFLDEIGDMPAELQTRLLRVLADGEFYRVGGHEAVRADVRIIAATHQDLEQLVREGRFREDLFHRLNVIRVHLPALRERIKNTISGRFFYHQITFNQEKSIRIRNPSSRPSRTDRPKEGKHPATSDSIPDSPW